MRPLLLAALLVSCTPSALDTAVYAANAAHATELTAKELLHERCTAAYTAAAKLPPAEILARVREVDRLCLPARKGYGVLRSARLTLLAAITVYQVTRDEAPLRAAVARLASAALSTAETVERLGAP